MDEWMSGWVDEWVMMGGWRQRGQQTSEKTRSSYGKRP